MDLMLAHGEFLETIADLGVIFVSKDGKHSHPHYVSVDRSLEGFLLKYAKQEGFEGNLGERLIIPTFGRLKIKKLCLIGIGERKALKQDLIRRAGGFLIKAAKETKAKTVALSASAVFNALHDERPVQALAEGMYLAAYEFREHFGTSDRSIKRSVLESVTIVESEKKSLKIIQKGFDRADALSRATRMVRDLVNTSPRHMCPSDLVEAAKRLAVKGSGISCQVIDREGMERLGMGAALAVGEGSQHPPAFVHLAFRPRKPIKSTIAVIGKGVTFDSGGLSLKTGDAMQNMKIDMAGAATVIGLFQALPALDIRTEVHGLFIAVENMPSGSSYRPGDVVRAMNGMTIEIVNTDAEGRVTMADAICYAIKKIKPDQLIDIATLTGASITAVGDDCAPFMSNDRVVAKRFIHAAKSAGELVWELPLIPHYDEFLRSKIADLNNYGGRSAGSIKAALFLQRFVHATPWLHMDIAGPAFCEREYRPDIPYGGTGFGVRTLAEYLQDLHGK